jgi:hypothetical protein
MTDNSIPGLDDLDDFTIHDPFPPVANVRRLPDAYAIVGMLVVGCHCSFREAAEHLRTLDFKSVEIE